jgi:hypothetical protein
MPVSLMSRCNTELPPRKLAEAKAREIEESRIERKPVEEEEEGEEKGATTSPIPGIKSASGLLLAVCIVSHRGQTSACNSKKLPP